MTQSENVLKTYFTTGSKPTQTQFYDVLDTMFWLPNTGPQGRDGNQGAQGNNGSNGVQGNQGNSGSQGSNGAQGNQGNIGAQGNQGNNGSNGTQGNQGNNGSNGAQGNQGNQGNIGTGVQGVQGPIGTGGTGSGISFIHSNTLFVDPNGNNSTAVLGDIMNPWQNIFSALQYLIVNNLIGYTIWVFPGTYIETNRWQINSLNSNTTIKLNGGVFITAPNTVSTLINMTQGQLTIIGDDEGQGFQQNNAIITANQIASIGGNSTLSITNVYLNASSNNNIVLNGSSNRIVLYLNNCYIEGTNNNIVDSSTTILNMSIRNCFFYSHNSGGKMQANILLLNPVAITNNIQIHNSRFYADGNSITSLRGQITTNAAGANPAYWITMSDVIFYSTAGGSLMWWDVDSNTGDSNNLDVIANVIGNQNTISSAGAIMTNITSGVTVLAGSLAINNILNYNR